MVSARLSRPAAVERSCCISTVTSNRCGLERSCSVTPTWKKTSRSEMQMVSIVSRSSDASEWRAGGGSAGERFQQESCRLIQGEFESFFQGQPAELDRLLVQMDARLAGAAAGVVEQDEMFVAVELR